MKIIITEQQFKQLISENYISDRDTFWGWVSPENQLIRVPKLKHQGFIMNKYKDAGDWAWDYDRVFDKALLDGWVRVIYEYLPSKYRGELSVNGHYEDRVINVIKTVFKDILKYGYKTLYVDIEEPKKSLSFSTYDSVGKLKLMNFLNEEKLNEITDDEMRALIAIKSDRHKKKQWEIEIEKQRQIEIEKQRQKQIEIEKQKEIDSRRDLYLQRKKEQDRLDAERMKAQELKDAELIRLKQEKYRNSLNFKKNATSSNQDLGNFNHTTQMKNDYAYYSGGPEYYR